jgi:rRNA maturation endonuclease Nob1
MLAEAVLAVMVGLAVLWLVLQPVVRPSPHRQRPLEPSDPEESPKGIALTALKEIEFDRETGKLSDTDYEFLKGKYTARALDALRQEEAAAFDEIEVMVAAKVSALRFASAATSSNVPAGNAPIVTLASSSCVLCGPRPEADALFCSSCGRPLTPPSACAGCDAPLSPESRYCESCGRQVAA